MEGGGEKTQIVFHQHAASMCSNFNLFSGCCPRHDRSVGIICRWDMDLEDKGRHNPTQIVATEYSGFISVLFSQHGFNSQERKLVEPKKNMKLNWPNLQQKLTQDNLETTSEITLAWPAPIAHQPPVPPLFSSVGINLNCLFLEVSGKWI